MWHTSRFLCVALPGSHGDRRALPPCITQRRSVRHRLPCDRRRRDRNPHRHLRDRPRPHVRRAGPPNSRQECFLRPGHVVLIRGARARSARAARTHRAVADLTRLGRSRNRPAWSPRSPGAPPTLAPPVILAERLGLPWSEFPGYHLPFLHRPAEFAAAPSSPRRQRALGTHIVGRAGGIPPHWREDEDRDGRQWER